MSGERETIGIGFIGCGTVGAEAVRILQSRRDEIGRYTGLDLDVVRVAVKDPTRDRGVALPADVFTTDPAAVVADDAVDVVVEVVGGLEPAGTLIADALAAGKPVVTANKELVAVRGPELLDVARAAGVDLLFEAAVGGGIPLIRPITESLAGEDIVRFMGIVNGTTNYILTRMAEDGIDFADALAQAQDLGYAEADPTADVDGHDAAQKAAILASLAFGTAVHADDVHCEGIRSVTARDIAMAERFGYAVKLLAIGEFVEDDTAGAARAVSVRVHPAMIPRTHPLASVRLSFNAVFVEGASAGEQMFYGRGAGGGPTAIAVVGDLIDAARNLRQGAVGPHMARQELHPVRRIDEIANQFYVRLEVDDRPGVLAAVAGVFAAHDVSIKSVLQHDGDNGAELVLVTHLSREADMDATLADLAALDGIREVASRMRVTGDGDV